MPKTNADGNDLTGIRVPEVVVPLATYTGWGLRPTPPNEKIPTGSTFATGKPTTLVDGCDANGQIIKFAATAGERRRPVTRSLRLRNDTRTTRHT